MSHLLWSVLLGSQRGTAHWLSLVAHMVLERKHLHIMFYSVAVQSQSHITAVSQSVHLGSEPLFGTHGHIFCFNRMF
jgi:hypothetical protein